MLSIARRLWRRLLRAARPPVMTAEQFIRVASVNGVHISSVQCKEGGIQHMYCGYCSCGAPRSMCSGQFATCDTPRSRAVAR